MQAFKIPDDVLTEVNRLLFRFLWRKKDWNRKAFEKVKRTVVCNDIENGGLRMIDVRQMQLSFLLHWAGRLCQAQSNEKWSWAPKTLFSRFGSKNEYFYANVNSSMFKGLKLVKSHFWQSVLETWIDNNRFNSTSFGCTLLWNNRNLTYQGQVFFFSKNGLKQEL